MTWQGVRFGKDRLEFAPGHSLVRKSSRTLVVFLVLFAWLTVAFAVSDRQLESIKSLGELNAIALHCKALRETRKMKRALIENLPKRRQLGELFDQQTHRSYMEFIRIKASCPGQAGLTEQVDAAIKHLQSVFRQD